MSAASAANPEFDDAPEAPAPAPNRSRNALLKRLADVVSLPSSRVNTFERAVTADLLVEILRDATFEERSKVARRLSALSEIPNSLIRLLLHDEIEVAQELLAESNALNDADLLDCIRNTTGPHRRMIAQRRGVSEVVSEALIALGETQVIETVLRNENARISHTAIEMVVALTRDQGHLVQMLLRRPELRPSHAYVLFWWAGPEARRTILQRFAVSREVLQEAAGDVFPMAAAEGWQDPLSRKALQFIERRQRNRAAIEKSPYESLEAAVLACEDGMTRELAEEIAYLSGIKPMTGAKIMTDDGGEPLAILCKATGLGRNAVRSLWRGLRRPETNEAGEITPGLERVLLTHDTLAVDRAQTVLRYWNWSLSSAMSPALLRAIQDRDESKVDEMTVPERSALLAFSHDLKE
jgi:uncharacterized protein (DUF2336 family)